MNVRKKAFKYKAEFDYNNNSSLYCNNLKLSNSALVFSNSFSLEGFINALYQHNYSILYLVSY